MMLLDKVVLSLLCFIAVIPFAQVFHLNTGFAIFNVYEILLLLLASVFILINFKRGIAKEHANYVFFVIAMFTIYSFYSFAFLDINFGSWINQTRNFLPFFVACMALLTRLYIDKSKLLNGITFALAISSFSAIIIHTFFKDFVACAFSSSDEVSRIILEGGRMHWGSSVLALFGLAALMIARDKHKRMLLGFAFLVILSGSLFTQNRTMLVGLLVFFVTTQLFVFKKSVKPVIYITFVSVIVAGVFLSLASDNMVALFQKRLFLTDSAGVEIDHALFVGRVGLYDQYLDRIFSSFPYGQGLGVPFSYGIFSGEPIFISDISLVSFSIPFGLLGLVALLLFIGKLFKSFKKYNKTYHDDKGPKVFYWLLFTSFLVSLNVDIFSRNIFVVYLSVFAGLYFVPSVKRMEKVHR